MENYEIIAFFFDSGRLENCFYGGVVFEHIFKHGNELTNNKKKMIVSLGDVFGDFSRRAVTDISPFLILDDVCSVDVENSMHRSLKDWPYVFVIEDIELSLARILDKRLKNELPESYLGMTKINTKSTDKSKQFWKFLIRDFSVFEKTITVFSNKDAGFGFAWCVMECGFNTIFDEDMNDFYEDDSILPETRQSSYVKTYADLREVEVENIKNQDLDRNILDINFQLRLEFQIAGTLIWKSIEDINKTFKPMGLENIHPAEYLFSSLYQASQGIERMQKSLIEIIIYNQRNTDYEKQKIKELLLSHNHNALHDFIVKKQGIKTKSSHNKLLLMLNNFYNNYRYARYSTDNKDIFGETKIFRKFGEDHNIQWDNEDYGYWEKVKTVFGSAVGGLSRKYWKILNDFCSKLHIFAYELDNDSPANFTFLTETPKNNLYTLLLRFERYKKEVIWKLIQDGKGSSLFKGFINIPAIDIDESLINSYIFDIIKNTYENNIESELDSIYDEMCSVNKENWIKHCEFIDAVIGNENFIISEDEDINEEE